MVSKLVSAGRVKVLSVVCGLGLAGGLLFAGPAANVPAAVAEPAAVRVAVEGQKISFPDVQPVLTPEGRVHIPVRALSEELGWRVDWSPSAQTVRVSRDGKEVSLGIGGTVCYVNGTALEMDTAPFIREERTFVPVRFVSQALGYSVNWDGPAGTVRVGAPQADVLPERVPGHIKGTLTAGGVLEGTLFLDGHFTVQVVQEHALRAANADIEARLEAAAGRDVTVTGTYLSAERVFEVTGLEMEVKDDEGQQAEHPGNIPGTLLAPDRIYGTLYLDGLFTIEVLLEYALEAANADVGAALEAAVGKDVVVRGTYESARAVFTVTGVEPNTSGTSAGNTI